MSGKMFLHSVAFVIGFTIVFSIVGILLQTILSNASLFVMSALRIIGGAVIIIFGLLMLISLKFSIPFFSSEHKLQTKKFKNSYLSSMIFGIAFAIGWTPCVGAILGSIYTLAAVSPGLGFILLIGYSLGLGIPFLFVGLFTDRVSSLIRKSRAVLNYFNIIGGLILIILGLLVLFNYIGIIAVFFAGSGYMSVTGQINFFIAFIAGFITFLSPCILPLLPAYFAYMASGVDK